MSVFRGLKVNRHSGWEITSLSKPNVAWSCRYKTFKQASDTFHLAPRCHPVQQGYAY